MRTPQPRLQRRTIMAMVASGFVGRRVSAQTPATSDPWPSLAEQIFQDRPISDGAAVLGIDAPYRADDAALVPISLHNLLPADDRQRIKCITLVVDENPSPVAAAFLIGDNSGITTISTRVRVDSYTNIHAVAETADGGLFAAKRFVKAAGGCSAPVARQEASGIPLGTMRFRQFKAAFNAEKPEAQVLIRHPNYSGMQMDQITRLYVPAQFVSTVRIWQGDDLLLGVNSGISISENPEFRFDYQPNGATAMRAEVRDSEGRLFNESWPVAPA